jgi:dTDP-4-amino-4,6-dideoxygalactose transaminase
MIPFNKAHITGKEITHVVEAMKTGKIGGDGFYTKACEGFFEKKYGFKKALLTSSCTDALELAAILIGIKHGDEVIMPSYSFPSTANAFILRGAKIVFTDSGRLNPNVSFRDVESLVTPFTKAIVVVHYGGISCDIIKIKKLADKHKIYLIEDAAQAIDCFYYSHPLGSFGHFATFSFHETKNITCGEGGLLVINDKKFIKRAEIIREKGTNKASFIRKEIKRYRWVDIGSSFLPSDITAAYLYAQLNDLDNIMVKRRWLWQRYDKAFENLNQQNIIKTPYTPVGTVHNGHIFYIVCKSGKIREAYMDYMAMNNVQTQSHYVTLHDSPFYRQVHGKRALPMAKLYQNRLVRLPIFYDLEQNDIDKIITLTNSFFLRQNNAE